MCCVGHWQSINENLAQNRVTLKNVQIFTGKYFQIHEPANADVKQHYIGIGSNKRH